MDKQSTTQPTMRQGRRRSDPVKRQPVSQLTPLVIGFVLFTMATVILFKTKGSKGTCSFDSTHKKAVCKVKHLTAIPDDIPSTVLSLHMGSKLDKAENSFTILDPSNFSSYGQLQELHLVKCGIQEIRSDTFSELVSLRHLDLKYNRLQSMSETTFRGLTNLEYLYLSNNPIMHLSDHTFRGIHIDNLIFGNNPAITDIASKAFEGAIVKKIELNRCSLSDLHTGTFSHLSGSLEEIHITNNLKPMKLPDKIFRGLKLKILNLDNIGLTEAEFVENIVAEEIYLDDNPLEDIDFDDSSKPLITKRLSLSNTKLKNLSNHDFSKLLNLEELDLEQNDLTILDARVFKDLKNLRILDLSNNDLSVMDGDFNYAFSSLQSLYLDDNDFETLPESLELLFSRLTNLTLDDNPLHCNCELKWLDNWVVSHPDIILELSSLSCATPEPMNFTQVPDHGFACHKPTILNATFDSDGISLVCTAEGDPPPVVSWIDDKGKECKSTAPEPFERNYMQTKCTITISKDGNYTCMATNLAGNDSEVIDTKKMPTSGLKFVNQSREIEILETPHGFFITAFLLILLGYIFRVS